MNNPTLFSPLILNLFILSFFLLSYNFIEAIDKFYQTCSSTVPKTCGDNQNITFPFYIQGLQEPYCGYPGFQVSCNNNGHPILNLSNEIYIIHKIFYQNQSLIVSNSAFSNPQTNYCIPFVQNLHLFSDRLQIIPNQSRVFLLYNCSSSLVKDFPKYNDIGCSVENRTRRVLGLSEKDKTQMDTNVSKCGKENLVVAPVMRYRDNNGDDENEINIREVLSRGFLMKWTASNCKFCEKSGGRCGFDHLNFLFKCYCPDRPHSARCDPLQKAEENIQNQPCPPSFLCGKLGLLTFPFNDNSQPLCGLYPINCTAPTPKIQLRKGGYWFQILNISQTNSIFINDTDLLPKRNSTNCEYFASLALPENSIISNVSTSDSLTIFNCSSYDTNYSAYVTCGDYELYYNNTIKTSPPRCSIVRLPTSRLDISTNPRCYSCLLKGSQCVSEERNGIKCSGVSKGGKKKLGLKLGLGIGCSIFVLCPLIFLIWRSYKKVQSSSNTISRNFSDPYSNSDLEGGSHYLGIPVFSYLDLVEATHYFDSKRELGDGGFGTVYYGVLKDGREVAVKRLYEHNCKRLHQFLNEILILTRLGHKNLVSLYGCTSRHSRELLLVYEYIPNGTVADHLHGDRAKIGCLTWPIRMSIAIETAAALTYLHASDIIHRDVKTNNILLDNNFNVKVADFGLSRLFPNDVTHISTAPQGTPGYVDPSYHQCYQLTTKSDVYSFGVVLVELISSMPAVDITRHTHEISLANLAINKIQMSAIKEMVDQSLGFETDNEVRRKIIAFAELAFQCLQQDKEVRPSMQKVLEDLKRIESGKNERDAENEEELYDNFKVTDNVHPTASPDCDEISLLKNIKPPTSPISVTQNWPSNISTTPNVSS